LRRAVSVQVPSSAWGITVGRRADAYAMLVEEPGRPGAD
jgi:hypothetical protein